MVEFRDVVLAYREDLPNALDGVSLLVRPGEKIGIVGRTGSGKSTMFLALFRMVEIKQGQILLDQLDVATVGLAQLRWAGAADVLSIKSVLRFFFKLCTLMRPPPHRSRLAIIPQDPFLFSGTIRENLDPCGRHQDQQLLDVLDQCHLAAVVGRMGEFWC